MNKCPKCNRNMLKAEKSRVEYCVKCEPEIAKTIYEDEEFKGWMKGNVIKYVLRAGHKNNELEDLKKARWCLDRLITLLDAK